MMMKWIIAPHSGGKRCIVRNMNYIGASTIAPKESLVLFYCMYDDINMILLEATTSASRLILLFKLLLVLLCLCCWLLLLFLYYHYTLYSFFYRKVKYTTGRRREEERRMGKEAMGRCHIPSICTQTELK